MKKLLLILLIFAGKNSSAKVVTSKEDSIAEYEANQETIEFKKNYFQMSYFSDFNSRSVYTDHGILKGNEMGSSSVSCGWIRQIKKHFAIDLDVELSRKNFTTGAISIAPNGTNTIQETQATYINNITYLNLPIGVNYSVGKKIKVGLYSGVALKFEIEDDTQFYKTYSDNSGRGNNIVLSGKNDDFNLEYRIAAFAEYNFKRVKYRVVPIYRVDMLNTYKGIDGKKANSIGIGFQLIL